MQTIDLLDAVKARQGWPSDYRLAKALNIGTSRVGNWRTGRSTPDEVQTLKLAELAGVNPAYALVSIAAERAKRTEIRAAWEDAAKKLATAAAVVLMGFFLPTVAQIDGGAAWGALDQSTHYAQIAVCLLALIYIINQARSAGNLADQ